MNCTNTASTSKVRRVTLLEEWPQVSNRCRATRSKKNVKVSFSTYSNLKIYTLSKDDERKKGYSKPDYKSFRLRALRDTAIVQAMMESCPYEGGRAIQYLIKNRILNPEHNPEVLIGIEGLIRGADKVAHERKRHSVFVLKMQKELLEGKANTEVAGWDVLLAAAATRHSLKAYEMARLRASLAA